MTTLRNCSYCSTEMEVTSFRRIFCSDKCRSRYNRENMNKCFYCGDLASTRDHITPHAVLGHNERHWVGLDYVNCCSNCNSILGAAHAFDLVRRVNYLLMRFTAKYKLDKGVVQWSEEELAELSPKLRRKIRGEQERYFAHIERLMHMRERFNQIDDWENEEREENLNSSERTGT